MEWKTNISKITEDGVILRGEKLDQLMESKSFTEVIFLTLKGKLPSKNEKGMLDAILVSSIVHSIGVPSITAARIIKSSGTPFSTAVAGGILAIGENHGGAVEKCAKLLQSGKSAHAIVEDSVKNKERIPGLGHKVYKDEDPRTVKLFSLAEKLNIYGKSIDLLKKIEQELENVKGNKFPINIDGAIAAIISDMGFSWEVANAFFIIPRTVGICANVHEECNGPLRRVNEEEIKYY